LSITPRFITMEDLLKAKYSYEKKTGESGAQWFYSAIESLSSLMLIDFKLSLELRLLLNFNFVFNFNFNFSFPMSFTYKAVYGPLTDEEKEALAPEGIRVGVYGQDVYDPERSSLTQGGRTGPQQGLESAGWRLSYTYISHYEYRPHNPLWHGRAIAKAYQNYFHASPEILVTDKNLDSSLRLVEALYRAACWYDFNSYDLGRYSIGYLVFRYPKDEAPEGSVIDKPLYDYDYYDEARYDVYERPDALYIRPADVLVMTRYDLSAYDVARYDLSPNINPDGIQREIDNYRLRSAPLVAGAIWVLSGEDMKHKGLYHLASNWYDRLRVKDLVSNAGVPIMDIPNYYKFMLEYKYNAVTNRYATTEDIIKKYVDLGLREDLLRRITKIIARK